MVKKRIALLGATGSIGLSTIQVITEQSDRFELVLASAHSKAKDLFRIANQFQIPQLVLTDKHSPALELPRCAKVYYGEEELLKLLKDTDYDIVVNAISGSAGLRSTIAALETGRNLALANKESLVMAGHLVKELQSKHGSIVLPVDSEHSAIFQSIGKHPQNEIAGIHITASGGAFRNLPLHDFDKITVEKALKHPNWDMGAKVTLDSATMFNKALEVMEAHWLFNLDWSKITAIIHPQSIIHSMVQFIDGSILAQMSVPDMKLPILYALSYPERYQSSLVQTNLLELPELTFEAIDSKRYPLFYLGIIAAKAGGIMPTIANAANEAALKLFMERKINFTQIVDVVKNAMDKTDYIEEPDLETIISMNKKCYLEVLGT